MNVIASRFEPSIEPSEDRVGGLEPLGEVATGILAEMRLDS
jgi:hypothetical protein